MKLVIGNKNYSSWSLRPWLGLKMAGIPFEEELIPLRQADSQGRLQQYDAAGKVPILIDGDIVIWESLAIAEYLAERFPDRGLWPVDREARAYARVICAEMHAGFATLRTQCPMDIRSHKTVALNEALQKDIFRISALWENCLVRSADQGGFLFGAFTWADAFFAPVVTRFATYGIDVSDPAQRYMERILVLPAMQEWSASAQIEPWTFE